MGVEHMANYKIEIQKIKEIMRSANSVVFFGGAGVSTDSGIPDFRSANGLYNESEETSEYLLSTYCLRREPEKFYRFYRTHMLYPSAKPNGTHLALAKLELELLRLQKFWVWILLFMTHLPTKKKLRR